MKMYERINADNWTKGELMSMDTKRMCLIGHIMEMGDFAADGILHRLAESIQALYPERGFTFKQVSPSMRVFSFNDDPRTTIDDVLRVCKLADV